MALPTQSSGDQITATIWNTQVGVINSLAPNQTSPTTTGNQIAQAIPTGTGMLWMNWAGASAVVFQGIAAGITGQAMLVTNGSTTASRTISLMHENGSASAANRIYCDGVNGNKVVLRRGQSALLVYGTTPLGSRWMLADVNRHVEFEYDNGNLGATPTVDFETNGPVQKGTRNANTSITLTAPSFPCTCILKLVHEASTTAHTLAFTTTVKWGSASAPSPTNSSGGVDIITLFWDGTTWWGAAQTDMR